MGGRVGGEKARRWRSGEGGGGGGGGSRDGGGGETGKSEGEVWGRVVERNVWVGGVEGIWRRGKGVGGKNKGVVGNGRD